MTEYNTLLKNIPMSRYTTWGVGGVADYVAIPENLPALQQLLSEWDSALPVTWLGLGSNVLIRDGGIRGLVVLTKKLQSQLSVAGENSLIVSAGVSCAKVSKFAAANNLGGAEFLAGIPGSMGGALAMNAGAFGGNTWDIVSQVEMIDKSGQLSTVPANQFAVAYRSVQLPEDSWFVSAQLSLEKGNKSSSLSKVKSILAQRSASQPIGQKSCGSVFKNPSRDHAARMIEQCGLKGHCIGGACVSNVHANFIVNQGNATAADIENLIEHVRSCVLQQFGTALQPEVRILGEELV